MNKATLVYYNIDENDYNYIYHFDNEYIWVNYYFVVKSTKVEDGWFNLSLDVYGIFSYVTEKDLSKHVVNNGFDDEDFYMWDDGLFDVDMDSLKLSLIKESVSKYANIVLDVVFNEWNSSNLGYLEVNENTSFYGNYEIDGKEFCEMTARKRSKIDHKSQVEYILSNNDNSEKSLSSKLINLVNNWVESREYTLCLSGNDDDSWTKGFDSLDELMSEISFLKICQPIDKDRHVKIRGYYFTN